MAFGLQLSDRAARALRSAAPDAAFRVRRGLEGLAELAQVAPPITPAWAGLLSLAPPLMRTTIDQFHVLYDVNPGERLLRVIDITVD